ncbi:MAG TPA: response regulator [Polyangiaceae bacterium]
MSGERRGPPQPALPAGAKVPVLLVDDKAANLLALEAVLEHADYELVRAESGRAALQAVERREFAVVLLDVQMPGMDGIDTAAQMRDVAKGGHRVPIVFVTGIDGDAALIQRAYSEGGIDFIQKPIKSDVLRGKVSVFAELYRARQRLLVEQTNATRAFRALTDLAVALSRTRAPDEVARVIVDDGMRLAKADACALWTLDDTGTRLELIGRHGIPEEVLARAANIEEREAPSVFALLRTGTTTWSETGEEYARIYPELAGIEVKGPRTRAFWSVPLIVEGRAVGLLSMGFFEDRAFAPDERSLVDALGRQCAQALLRARRMQGEDRARAWLTTTLRSIGDAVIATDTSGAVTFMNAIAERMTGWNEAEARGRPLGEVFAIFAEETRAPENPVAKAMREGHAVEGAGHTVLRAKSGVEILIDDSGAPIRDASGALLGVVLVFRDVSAHKREEVRRDFLAQAGAVLASSLDYRATLAAVARLAVPQLADWCSVDLLEPGARAPHQVALAHVDPEKVRRARALAQRYPSDPNAPTGVPHVVRSGTSELYAEVSRPMLEARAKDEEHLRLLREVNIESAMVVPLRGRERTLGAMSFLFADSGRRYSAQDLAFAEEFARRAAMAIENALAIEAAEFAHAQERVLRQEADIASKAKDEFLAVVSHELRTPLNVILGWTVTLRQRSPGEELDRALAIVERNARRQARLIEDVLDISRITSGKLTLKVTGVSVAEVVANAVEAVTPAAAAKEIRFQVESDPSLTMLADGDRLQQAIWNLLANSVKFTPAKGSVKVVARRHEGLVQISVTDDGEGIAIDALPFIFEPFRQADASTTRTHGGLGLGLAIVRQLVAAHGGTIEARSEGPGRGATFVMTLPARVDVPTIRSPALADPDAEPPGATPRLDGLSVIVVDDEEDARGIIERILLERGATVTTVETAKQALERIAAHRPDAVVSDIGMPEMDGYAFVRAMRALPARQGGGTPAIALTAYAGTDDARMAMEAGFQVHLAKPVEPSELVMTVARVAGMKASRSS